VRAFVSIIEKAVFCEGFSGSSREEGKGRARAQSGWK